MLRGMHEAGDPDRAVVERAQAGDERAFDELMARYQKPVFHFVHRMVGGATDAEDVAQETFVRVFFNLARFRFRAGALFSTWLFQVARRAALDRVRARKRRPEEPLPPRDEVPDPAHRDGRAQADQRELGDAIARAFAELPEDQRAALVLTEYHGHGAAEVAAIMGCTVRSVEARLYRARQEMRRLLGSWRSSF